MDDATRDNSLSQRRAFLRRLLRFVGVLLLAFLPLALFDSSCTRIYQGGYELTVHVEASGPKPSAVGCYAVWRQDEAERAREIYQDIPLRRAIENEWGGPIADPYTGQSLKVQIRMSDQESYFGRPLSTVRQRFLVLLAEWPDGRKVCKVVELPQGRVSKEVTVCLP